MTKRISDPIDRIVRLVIAQIGRTPFDDVAKGYTIEVVTHACREDIEAEFESWYKARCAIKDLELQEKMRRIEALSAGE